MNILKGILAFVAIGIVIYGLWFIFYKSGWIALIAVIAAIVFGIILIKCIWKL